MRLANLRAGALDLIERILPTDIPSVRSDPKLKLLLPTPPIAYTGLTINLANTDRAKNPLGQNAKVRQALDLSIDRDAINQVVFNGDFTPGNQWSAPTNQYYVQKFPVPKRNVEKAKALIKEAGVATPITLELMVPNQPDVKQVAEVLQAMAGEAGFDLKIRLTEFTTSLDEAVKGNFQLYLIGWSGRIDPGPERHQSSRLRRGAVQLGKVLQRDGTGRPGRGAHGQRAGQAQGGLRKGARRRSRPTSR